MHSNIHGDHQETFAFPLYATVRRVLNKVMTSKGMSVVLMAPLLPQNMRLLDPLCLLMAEPLQLPTVLGPAGSTAHSELSSVVRYNKTPRLEVIQRSLIKSRFSSKAAVRAVIQCGKFSASLYLTRWSSFCP